MKRFLKSVMFAVLLAGMMVAVLAPNAAAQTGSISGTVLDITGKAWFGLTVEAVNEQGAKTRSEDGHRRKVCHPQSSSRDIYADDYRVSTAERETNTRGYGAAEGDERRRSQNAGHELQGTVQRRRDAAAAEKSKKDAEEKQKFEGMKTHFAAGAAFLVQEQKAKDDLTKAPADQRDALKQNLKDLSDKAAAEFQAAQKAAPEKDPNLALIWGNLGQAYDIAGRNDEAAEAYQQAITAKPDNPGYYNNLGNVLARAGKIDEARAAYTKSAELDPTKAATAWRNFGISLYNANRGADAIEPLQKSAELDPNNAQTWYLLGACLVYKMTVKKVGDKDVPEFAPGTIEAYKKAVELDPDGVFGKQAQEGLAQLQQMAPGIDIRVTKKKKS